MTGNMKKNGHTNNTNYTSRNRIREPNIQGMKIYLLFLVLIFFAPALFGGRRRR